jgi:hypothetical protein
VGLIVLERMWVKVMVRERRTWGDGSIRSCGDEDGRRKREKGDSVSKKIIFFVYRAWRP